MSTHPERFVSRGILFSVKTIRIWLLVLLAMLVPLRGALAAAMICPEAHAGVHGQAADEGDARHHESVSTRDDGVSPDGDESDHEHPGSMHPCNLCSACCSPAALVSDVIEIRVTQPVAPLFPALVASRPEFVSGGPERPPRSI